MQRLRFVLTMGILVILLMSISTALAQQRENPDRDGDGLPNEVDDCPDEAGPRENGGCPVPAPANPDLPSEPAPDTSNNSDSDQDGVFDPVDFCPQAAGPADNGGCPVEEIQPFIPHLIPQDGACSVVANHPEGVNVREYFSLQAPIVGVLDPAQTYPIQAVYYKPDETWYLVIDPAGFVLSDVVVKGGQCDDLTQVCVYVLPGTEVETTFAQAPPAIAVVGAEAEDSACDPIDNAPPQTSDPQLGVADDSMSWSPYCYLGLNGELSLGVTVMTTLLGQPKPAAVYQSPFDEDPITNIGGGYHGMITDGPVCRDNVIMWRVNLKSQWTGDEILSGWIRYYFLFPIPA